MRSLLKQFDLDDLRWCVVGLLVVGLSYALDAAWRAEDRSRIHETRLWELEMESAATRRELLRGCDYRVRW